jgi:hypothetical protein
MPSLVNIVRIFILLKAVAYHKYVLPDTIVAARNHWRIRVVFLSYK